MHCNLVDMGGKKVWNEKEKDFCLFLFLSRSHIFAKGNNERLEKKKIVHKKRNEVEFTLEIFFLLFSKATFRFGEVYFPFFFTVGYIFVVVSSSSLLTGTGHQIVDKWKMIFMLSSILLGRWYKKFVRKYSSKICML